MKYNSLYIHIPFCAYICDYCAFYTIEKANSILRNVYLKRLDEELRDKGERCGPLQTVYIGGGTPSYFSLAELERVMAILHRHFVSGTGL